jgi:hypothetical protein
VIPNRQVEKKSCSPSSLRHIVSLNLPSPPHHHHHCQIVVVVVVIIIITLLGKIELGARKNVGG